MRVVAVDCGIVRTELNQQDVLVLSNALNEVCNALDVPEFSIRMGVSRDEALALLAHLHDLYAQVVKSNSPDE